MIGKSLLLLCCLLVSFPLWARETSEKKTIVLGRLTVAPEHRRVEKLIIRNVYDVIMQIGAFDLIIGGMNHQVSKTDINLTVRTRRGEVTVSNGLKKVRRRRRDGKDDPAFSARLATIQLLLGKNYLEKNWDEILEVNKRRAREIAKNLGMRPGEESEETGEDSSEEKADDDKIGHSTKNSGKNKNNQRPKGGENADDANSVNQNAQLAAKALTKKLNEKGSAALASTPATEGGPGLSDDATGNKALPRPLPAPSNAASINPSDSAMNRESQPESAAERKQRNAPIRGEFTPQVDEVLPSIKKSTPKAEEEFFLRAGFNLLEGTNEDVIATSTHLEFLTFGLTWRSFAIPSGEDFLSRLFLELDAEAMKAIKTAGYDVSLGKNLRGYAATPFTSSLLLGIKVSYETLYLGALKGLGEGLTLQEITAYSSSFDVRYRGSIFKAPATLGLSYGLILLGQNKDGEAYAGSLINPDFEVKINQDWGFKLGGKIYQLEGKRKALGTSSGNIRELYLQALYYF